MKEPQKPLPLNELWAKYSDRIAEILASGVTATPKGVYRHWDNLRHLTPPDDLNHEEWWLGVKLARRQLLKPLPLKDAGGKKFSYAISDIVLEMLHKIDSMSRGKIELPEQVTSPETRDRYIFKSLIEEAITSSQLEGASTTWQVASDMIRYGRKPRDTGEQMIFNNYEAINIIRRIKKKELTPAIVLDLHKILTTDTLDNPSAAGRLQTPDDERVQVVDNASHRVLHSPPPAEQLPKRLQEMCDFANGKLDGGKFIHPVVKAVVLHFWLAYDHPFLDGNGRTARALFYWSMLSQEYWLFEYVSISRILKEAPGKYGKSYLFTETDDNDLTYFLVYQLEVMLRAIHDLELYLQKKIKQVKEVERYLKKTTTLNHRQIALLSHAIRHPGAEYSIKSHQNSHNIAYATSRSDLLNLVDRNLLTMRKIGEKTNLFLSPQDIRKRLSETSY